MSARHFSEDEAYFGDSEYEDEVTPIYNLVGPGTRNLSDALQSPQQMVLVHDVPSGMLTPPPDGLYYEGNVQWVPPPILLPPQVPLSPQIPLMPMGPMIPLPPRMPLAYEIPLAPQFPQAMYPQYQAMENYGDAIFDAAAYYPHEIPIRQLPPLQAPPMGVCGIDYTDSYLFSVSTTSEEPHSSESQMYLQYPPPPAPCNSARSSTTGSGFDDHHEESSFAEMSDTDELTLGSPRDSQWWRTSNPSRILSNSIKMAVFAFLAGILMRGVSFGLNLTF